MHEELCRRAKELKDAVCEGSLSETQAAEMLRLELERADAGELDPDTLGAVAGGTITSILKTLTEKVKMNAEKPPHKHMTIL